MKSKIIISLIVSFFLAISFDFASASVVAPPIGSTLYDNWTSASYSGVTNVNTIFDNDFNYLGGWANTVYYNNSLYNPCLSTDKRIGFGVALFDSSGGGMDRGETRLVYYTCVGNDFTFLSDSGHSPPKDIIDQWVSAYSPTYVRINFLYEKYGPVSAKALMYIDDQNNRYLLNDDFSEYSTSVDGSCGSANGGSFEDTPTINLCDSGLATEVQDDGETYLWTCQGTGGGSNDYCSANVTIGSYTPMLSQIIFPLSNLTGITLGSTTEISSSSLSLTGDVYYAGFDETLNVDQIQFILQNINDYSEIKSNIFSFEEYLTSNENTESFSVSFTGIPENEKYLVSYNVHTTTGRTLKMLPPDATYVRYGIFTPVPIPVDFDSNNYTAPECSLDNMGACFKSIILWAFTPSENTIQKWKNTSETISSKVPFGYFYLVANKIKSIQLDTLSPSTNLAIDFVINNQTMRFLDIRQLIEEIGQENYDFYMNLCRAVIWFMFLEYLFNRLTGLGSGESVIQGFKPN